jgi:small subunit ribosomal protein S8
MTDPIADMLTRVRNGVMAGHTLVAIPGSNMKTSIAEILKKEGFIDDFEIAEQDETAFKVLRIKLKYVGDRRDRTSVISGLERVSKPGRRVYAKRNEIPWILSGLGIAILSTSKGVMSGRSARKEGLGGEILCKVW